MAITPQTNTTLADIADALSACREVIVAGHKSPDGDCIGSQLTLVRALELSGCRAVAVRGETDSYDAGLLFLHGIDQVLSIGQLEALLAEGSFCPDAFVVVDAPNPSRLDAQVAEVRQRLLDEGGVLSVTVDHHYDPDCMSQLSYTDPEAASASLLVWELASSLGVQDDPFLAECAYTGLYTDTGRFQFQNTDARAFAMAAAMVEKGVVPSKIATIVDQSENRAYLDITRVALEHAVFGPQDSYALTWLSAADFQACSATKNDADDIVNVLRSVRGVRVACVLREQDGEVRGSLRAKDSTNVADLARRFNGGGHPGAAGCTLKGMSAQEAAALMEREIAALLDLCEHTASPEAAE